MAGSRTFAVFGINTGGEGGLFGGFAILGGGGSGGRGESSGGDFSFGGGSRKNGPLDPESDFCKSLLQKIKNIRKDISKRMDEFMRNPQNLPLQIPGAKLRDDQLGHLKIIMDAHDNLQRRIEEYTDRCGGPPPGIPIPGNPVGNKSPRTGINRQAAAKAAAATGGLVTAYFIVRTILRVVYPQSNLVPVP